MANNFTYTAPYSETHVSKDLYDMALLFIELMTQQQEQNKSYGELIRTKDALAQFGFKNSQNTKLLGEMTTQMKEYQKATDTLAFIEEVWAKFGTDAMVVRYDQFFQILEKYDMVCGSFDRYTGAIPQSAIDTLTRLDEMWKRKELDGRFACKIEANQHCVVTDEAPAVKQLKRQLRIPFRADNQDICDLTSNLIERYFKTGYGQNQTTINDVLFIAAPVADMEPLRIEVRFWTDKIKKLCTEIQIIENKYSDVLYPIIQLLNEKERASLRERTARNRAIREEKLPPIRKAIDDEEERLQTILADSDINRYAEISFIDTEPERSRLLRDSFICSLTSYGVLIHAKWGAEAEDATIKRYELLRDAIIGKPKSITE